MLEIVFQTKTVYQLAQGPIEDKFECKDVQTLNKLVLEPAGCKVGEGLHSHVIFYGKIPVGQIREIEEDLA
jgi:hypothetical protein